MSEEDSSWPSAASVRITAARAHPEIELYASEALARFGASGTLRVERNSLVLYAPQGLLRVELEGLDDQWAGLSDESRRRASALVRRLMARRSLLPTPPPRRSASVWAWPLVLVAAAAALWAAFAARPQASDEVVLRTASANSPRGSTDAIEGPPRACRSGV